MTITKVLAGNFNQQDLRFWEFLRRNIDARMGHPAEFPILTEAVMRLAEFPNGGFMLVNQLLLSRLANCTDVIIEHGSHSEIAWENEPNTVAGLFLGIIHQIHLALACGMEKQVAGETKVGYLTIPDWYAVYCRKLPQVEKLKKELKRESIFA